MDKCSGLSSFQEDCSNALVIAAKSGEIRTVDRLLTLSMLDRGSLGRAVLAALDSGSEQVAQVVMKKILGHSKALLNLSTALHRAAFLDLPGATRLIIPSITLGNSKTVQEVVFLNSACRGGSLEIAEMFLKNEAEIYTHTEQGSRFLQGLEIACKYGYSDIAILLARKMLAESTIESEDKFEVGRDSSWVFEETLQKSLEIAIIHGQHRTLRTILDAFLRHGRQPALFEHLVQVAISNGRAKCCRELISCLTKSTEPEQHGLDMNTLVKNAITKGDVAMLWELKGIGKVVNPQNFAKLLASAMNKADRASDLVEFLIEEGNHSCTKQQLQKDLTIALGSAVTNGCEKIAILLVEEGVDLEDRTIYGLTPLNAAASRGQINLLKCLIKANADLNTKSEWEGEQDWQPIRRAHDNVDALRLLLEAGADIDAKTSKGSTALFMASNRQRKDSIKELLKHKPDLDCLVDGRIGLSSAIYAGNIDLVAMLLDAGTDPCRYRAEELDPLLLHSYVQMSQPEILKLLLEYGFFMDATDSDGNTALNSISFYTQLAVIKLLVNRGASINTVNHVQETPLLKAVRSGEVDVVKYLLSKDADIDIRADQWGTALHAACYTAYLYSLDMVKTLLDNGANINSAAWGVMGTPLQAACRRQHDEDKFRIIDYLLKTDKVDIQQSSNWWGCNLNVACLTADLNVVDLLIKRGARIDAEDAIGRRPIHFALYRTVDYVKRLCEAGTDLEGEDLMKRSALHFAVLSGRLEVVKYVLSQRKELVSYPDLDDWTPLLWAVRECDMWNTEISERAAIIEELCRCGASLMVQGKELDRVWTPFRLARYYRLDDDIVKLVTPSDKEIMQSEDKSLWRDSNPNDIWTARKYFRRFCDACLMVSST